MASRNVTKQLAGHEDLLIGNGPVTQTRSGTEYQMTAFRPQHTVDTIADLQDVVYSKIATAATIGGVAINDGLGGEFYWDAASTATHDGTTVIQVSGVVTGRWLIYSSASLAASLAEATALTTNARHTTPYNFLNSFLAAIPGNVPKLVLNKTNAKLIEPTVGASIIILSADGNGRVWVAKTGLTGQVDNGGTYCGTLIAYNSTSVWEAENHSSGVGDAIEFGVTDTVGYSVYDPTITVTTVIDGLSNTRYNSMSGIGKDVDDTLMCVWNGNPNNGSAEGDVGQDIFASISATDGDSWGTVFNPVKDVGIVSNPFTGVGTLWMQVVPRIIKDKFCVAWACGRGQVDEGAFLTTRSDAGNLLVNNRMLQNTTTGKIELRSELLLADIPAGYTHEWVVDGDIWFAYPQWLHETGTGQVLIGVTLLPPSGTFSDVDKRNVVLYSDDLGDFTVGPLIPLGEVEISHLWEWGIAETSTGFNATFRINFDTVSGGVGTVTSTPSQAYKFASANSSDGINWSPITYIGLLNHEVRATVEKVDTDFHVLTIVASKLERKKAAVLFSKNGSPWLGSIPFSDEGASQHSHVASAYVDSINGFILCPYGIGPDSAGFAMDIRVAKLSTVPHRFENNIYIGARGNPTLNGTNIELQGGDAVGVDCASGQSVTFNLVADVVPSSNDPLIMVYAGDGIGAIQVQRDRTGAVTVRPTSNAIVGSPIGQLDRWDDVTDVYSMNVGIEGNKIIIGGVGYPITVAPVIYIGDYAETGHSDATVMVLDTETIALSSNMGVYSEFQWGSRNLIRNPVMAIDNNGGAPYGVTLNTTLDGWFTASAGGSTFSINAGSYSDVATARDGLLYKTKMDISVTVSGSTALKLMMPFDDARSFAGRYLSLLIDLSDGNSIYHVMQFRWVVNFGSGGSPTTQRETIVRYAHVDVEIKRRHLRFVAPELLESDVFGTNGDSYAALQLSFPAEQALIRPNLSKLDLYESPFVKPFIDNNEGQHEIDKEYQAITVDDADQILVNGYMHSATEFRGYLQYPLGEMREPPTLHTEGTFIVMASSNNETGITINLIREGKTGGEIQVTGLTGFTAGEGASIRADNDLTAKIKFDARILK
jgi:hypothetical protein